MGDISKTPRLSAVKTITAATTLQATDAGLIFVSNATGFSITLPPAASAMGVVYTFVKTHAAAAAATLDGHSTELINGSQTYAAMDALYDTATIACNGTAWHIVDKIIA
jgi:hypothetical protein